MAIYDQHLKGFETKENYAKVIKDKLASGQAFSDKASADAFMKDNPDLFNNYQPQNNNSYINDQTQLIKNMYEADKSAQIAKIQQAKQNAISNINSQQGDLNTNYANALNKISLVRKQATPTFQNQRNQADLMKAQDIQKLRESMARQGIIGGDNLTQQAMVSNMGRANINAINLNENQYNANLDNQINDITAERINNLNKLAEARRLAEDGASAEEVTLAQSMASQQSRAMLDMLNRADDRAFKVDDINYQRYRDTLADQRYDQQWDWQTNPNNPSNQSQITSNKIRELELANLPKEQALRLQQIKAQIANMGPSATEQQMQAINLELAKIKLEQAKNPATSTQLTAKDSTDNYYEALNQIDSIEGITKTEALEYIRANRDQFTDADYKRLIQEINNNY